MKKVILAVTLAALVAISSFAVAGNTEYKLTRIQYTASDGVHYDTARRNLYLIDSQAVISSNAFWLKAEIVNGNYINSDRDVFEKYLYTLDGSNLKLTNSKGQKSTATILRFSPLRIKFDTGVTLNFRSVSYTGRDRNPHITIIQTVNNAIDNVVENETEIGSIGF